MVEGIDDLFGASAPAALRYHDFLADAGITWGVVGPREASRLWERHLLPCAAIQAVISDRGSVVDVGSGAGLPGIPLALARPDLSVTLLEPTLRRSNFLFEAVQLLGLSERVSVVRARAEDHQERYDCVVSRAVAPLTRLIPWCLPLVASAGTMVAMKGANVNSDLDEAKAAGFLRGRSAEVVELEVAGSEQTTVVIIK